ncbi:MAG: cytochrome ubiquinol oxidase subunit I [Actinobacteria bacterium]|nr:cytochrome ubiquinol oxidase subunit I [Actinomycetota bacterium]
MSVLELSRWQFGITTVYHFLFVPITIGLAFLVAGFETAWLRSGDERWLRLTKFYGKLFLINFAMGVVTGIVQEFQFGMNWSAYSRFVGDIFGAPLAIEALLAFFMESTFLGLWIFGWDRLSPRLHAACMWLTAVGTMLSAYFILAANSWMQHPVGYHYNPATHREELTNFVAVLTNPTQLVTFPHTIAGAFLVAGALVAAVALWHLIRRPAGEDAASQASATAFRSAAKAGAITTLVAAVATAITGDIQGKIMTKYQPMKMAAAEALWHTSKPASFSLFTIGTLNGSKQVFAIKIPGLLSFLATGSFGGKVDGIDNIQALYTQIYGPGSYTPIIPVTYWSFRLMIGVGMLAALIALVALWLLRRSRREGNLLGLNLGPRGRRVLLWSVIALPLLPLAANSFGWVFTEMGRQPWLVFGQMKTAAGVSANSAGEVLASMIILTLLYGGLAVVEVGLLLKYARAGLAQEPPPGAATDEDQPLELVY